jgi:hypothetical protein
MNKAIAAAGPAIKVKFDFTKLGYNSGTSVARVLFFETSASLIEKNHVPPKNEH